MYLNPLTGVCVILLAFQTLHVCLGKRTVYQCTVQYKCGKTFSNGGTFSYKMFESLSACECMFKCFSQAATGNLCGLLQYDINTNKCYVGNANGTISLEEGNEMQAASLSCFEAETRWPLLYKVNDDIIYYYKNNIPSCVDDNQCQQVTSSVNNQLINSSSVSNAITTLPILKPSSVTLASSSEAMETVTMATMTSDTTVINSDALSAATDDNIVYTTSTLTLDTTSDNIPKTTYDVKTNFPEFSLSLNTTSTSSMQLSTKTYPLITTNSDIQAHTTDPKHTAGYHSDNTIFLLSSTNTDEVTQVTTQLPDKTAYTTYLPAYTTHSGDIQYASSSSLSTNTSNDRGATLTTQPLASVTMSAQQSTQETTFIPTTVNVTINNNNKTPLETTTNYSTTITMTTSTFINNSTTMLTPSTTTITEKDLHHINTISSKQHTNKNNYGWTESDDRPSAISVGVVATAVLLTIIILIIILDLGNLRRDIKRAGKLVKAFCRRKASEKDPHYENVFT